MEFFSDESIGKTFSFTGKTLTLADLERATANEPLSDAARESWNYFGFDRDDEWKAVLSGSEAILIMDEGRDLNLAGVYPDTDSLILWLEASHEERERENEKERRFKERKQQEQSEQQIDTTAERASA